MVPRIVAGSASGPLAAAVATAMGTELVDSELDRFPDGELRPCLDGVRDDDVYVVQSTGPPVNDHVVELLLLLDACRRAGAGRVNAVVPYFGYARQDRRRRPGDALGAPVLAGALEGAGAERLLVVDPHTVALEAMFRIPVEMLSAVPLIADALAPSLPDESVLVAPDLGAVKLAERFAARLSRPVAVVRKSRLTGATVEATELIGDVAGRRPVIVDDMISTGATIEAAVEVLLAHGAASDIAVVATHGLLVGGAVQRLAGLPIQQLVVTDTVAPGDAAGLPRQVLSVAGLMAGAIARPHVRRR